MPSWPEPCDVFILFKVEDNLSVIIAEKEKLKGGVSIAYSPDKSGLAFFGIFSLSLFPTLQKYSFIEDRIVKTLKMDFNDERFYGPS